MLLATVTKGTAACNEIVDKVGGQAGGRVQAGRRVHQWIGRWMAVLWERQRACSLHWRAPPTPPPPHPAPPGAAWVALPTLQCNLAFDRVSLKGGRKGGGGGGSTIGLGLPMGMLGGMGGAGFL